MENEEWIIVEVSPNKQRRFYFHGDLIRFCFAEAYTAARVFSSNEQARQMLTSIPDSRISLARSFEIVQKGDEEKHISNERITGIDSKQTNVWPEKNYLGVSIPNLDDIPAEDMMALSDIFRHLAEYTIGKYTANLLRHDGQIAAAKLLEVCNEQIYKKLPENLRW